MTGYGRQTGEIGFMPGVVPGLRGPVVHFVKSGETLHVIARLYGTTMGALIRENRLRNPNLIYPGQRLTIPGSF
ncbi:MAG TPA: LysM domain-containing protein [Verrucomicrobiae bacterium]|nr:LysM domain-containing protein [Verrucomicrobiae bacterium]